MRGDCTIYNPVHYDQLDGDHAQIEAIAENSWPDGKASVINRPQPGDMMTIGAKRGEADG